MSIVILLNSLHCNVYRFTYIFFPTSSHDLANTVVSVQVSFKR